MGLYESVTLPGALRRHTRVAAPIVRRRAQFVLDVEPEVGRVRWKPLYVMIIATLAAATLVHAKDKCSYDAQTCLDYLIQEGKAGWAGIEGEMSEHGYRITRLVEGAPAAKADLRVGDVLTKVNGAAKGDANFEKVYRDAMKPGNTVTFTFLRGNKTRFARVELVSMPRDVFALMVGRHMLKHAETQRSDSDH